MEVFKNLVKVQVWTILLSLLGMVLFHGAGEIWTLWVAILIVFLFWSGGSIILLFRKDEVGASVFTNTSFAFSLLLVASSHKLFGISSILCISGMIICVFVFGLTQVNFLRVKGKPRASTISLTVLLLSLQAIILCLLCWEFYGWLEFVLNWSPLPYLR